MSVKVYIAPSTNYNKVGLGEFSTEELRCKQISEVVKRELTKYPYFEVKINKYRFRYNGELAKDCNNFLDGEVGIYVGIHTNSTNDIGMFGYFKGEANEKNDSYIITKYIQEEIGNLYNRKDKIHEIKNGETKTAELSMNKHIACVIEIGNCKNIHDVNYILENIEKIGISIANSIIRFCNDRLEEHLKKDKLEKIKIETYDNHIKVYTNDEVLKDQNSEIINLQNKVKIIEEKLEGLAEYLKIKEK